MKICIDAGHNYSGADTGACGNGLKEQDITFSIAYELAKKLNANGVNVVMTRENRTKSIGRTVNESLSERCRIANTNNCDLFISIHCNAGGGTGTETYIYSNNSSSSDMAYKIQDNIVNRLQMQNRGVKVNPSLYILRHTNMPAILIELGFIDNSEDSEKLNRTDDFATAISYAICGRTELTTANDIIWELSQKIEINEVDRAVKALEKAQKENSSLYYILKKIVNGDVLHD